MTQDATVALAPDALVANRNGALTDLQRKSLRRSDRAARKNNLVVVPVLAVLCFMLLRGAGPPRNAWLRSSAGVGTLAIAAILLLRSFGVGDKLAVDLQNERVESIEGALGKRIQHTYTGRSSRDFHYFDVAGHSFEVPGGLYRAAPDAGIVRLYFLPRSRTVVNLERLPDNPLSPDILGSPAEAIKVLATALLSRDRTQVADARAAFAAMRHMFTVATSGAATPPPPDERDPRPLSQAAVGRWRTGPLTLDFRPDGTVEFAAASGLTKSGRWWVDHQGRLHADAMGYDQVAQAWVARDALTISMEGKAVVFRRV